MKFYQFVIIFIIIVVALLAGLFIILLKNVDAARYDWSKGQPTTTDNQTNTTYWCWSKGQPTICYQYQAPAVGGGAIGVPEIWWE